MKASLKVVFALLLLTQIISANPNQFKGTGNIAKRGTENKAVGQNNRFEGYRNQAYGNDNNFKGDNNSAEGDKNAI
jgi:hypothetical protein